MANGVCDNILLATYLSAKCPVYFAPAMDLDMYKHNSTKASFDKLTSYGNKLIPAGTGELASGLVGEGRMAEPEDIVSYIENEVILVTGPTHQKIESNFVAVKPVVSAEEMYNEVHKHFETSDIAILSAAVADYRPKNVADQKIKKKDSTFTIELEKTKDILKSLGEIKTNQFLVGFALETNNELEHAKGKLRSKNLDLIVLNSLQDKGAGFGVSTNKVTFITSSNTIIENELKSKADVAIDLMQLILKQTHA